MHIHALDTYLHGDSAVHRLDPRVKLVITLLFILTAALTPDRTWVAFVALETMVVSATFLSRVGFGTVQKRAAVALPFTMAALTVLFSTPGHVLLRLPILGSAWGVTDAGLLRFFSIVFRSYISVQAAVVLAATTPFPDLLWGIRALRVPKVLVAISSFLYRYLFVLADEAQRMMRAREARSATPDGKGGGSIAWRARVAGGMAGSLFIRSYERSERIYSAMLARGYDGDVRTLTPPTLRPINWIIGIAITLCLGAVLILGRTIL